MPIIKTVGIISKPDVRRRGELVPEADRRGCEQRGIAVRLDEETGAVRRRAAGCRATTCRKAAT